MLRGVRVAMLVHYKTALRLYDYYCALGDGPEATLLQPVGFRQFLKDFSVPDACSRGCTEQECVALVKACSADKARPLTPTLTPRPSVQHQPWTLCSGATTPSLTLSLLLPALPDPSPNPNFRVVAPTRIQVRHGRVPVPCPIHNQHRALFGGCNEGDWCFA